MNTHLNLLPFTARRRRRNLAWMRIRQ